MFFKEFPIVIVKNFRYVKYSKIRIFLFVRNKIILTEIKQNTFSFQNSESFCFMICVRSVGN